MSYRPTNLFMTLFLLAALSSGCSSLNNAIGDYLELDTDLQIIFNVESDINPDDTNKPSPVFLRLYELKSTKMFNKSDFIDLYEKDKDILGADLVKVQKIKRLKPGESRDDHFVLEKDTQYVALYAEFLKYRDSEYRIVIPVTRHNIVRTTAHVSLSGNSINLLNKSMSTSSGKIGADEDEFN